MGLGSGAQKIGNGENEKVGREAGDGLHSFEKWFVLSLERML